MGTRCSTDRAQFAVIFRRCFVSSDVDHEKLGPFDRDIRADDLLMTVQVGPLPRTPRLNRYVQKIFHARGGMGEVWRSYDSTIGREVAMKKLGSHREAALDRFVAEAQITGQLEHPAIVPVHDLGIDDNGSPFYVMKFVHGTTLKRAIQDFHSPELRARRRQVEMHRLLNIFIDLCHAIAYAHSRGVIHRDIKPENVMLGEYGETVVLDWGLAKVIDQPNIAGGSSSIHPIGGSSTLTGAGSVMGSPLYMAPEMAEGLTAQTDKRTDVYL